MINKNIINYKNFGKCFEISNGKITAIITVDVGPRIIFYGYKGYNMLHEDIERKVQKSGKFFDENFVKGEKWYLYGGHRLWRAIEDMGSYVPDNYPVKYLETKSGALFIPDEQSYTKLQLKLKVEMENDGSLLITESFENKAKYSQVFAPWSITAMRGGGTEIIPLNSSDTGFLPCQNMVIWPYNDAKDPRFSFSKNYAILHYDKIITKPFKIGFYNIYGWSAYALDNYLFIKKFNPAKKKLPDFHCNFETYVNGDYIESEILSDFVTLHPNESITMTEKFELYKNINFNKYDDDTIKKTINKIL